MVVGLVEANGSWTTSKESREANINRTKEIKQIQEIDIKKTFIASIKKGMV